MSDVLSPGILGLDVSEKLVRLAELEAATSSLLHDVRGKLTTALLVANRLRMHFDPKVVKAGETVVTAIISRGAIAGGATLPSSARR